MISPGKVVALAASAAGAALLLKEMAVAGGDE